ncbi:MAG TPA: hypothetical protein VGL81_00085 [Polyangiaceae bacterium]|jgi:hypothetical protein
MRKAGLGLALVACAQLTLLSTPALADNASDGTASMPVQETKAQKKATEEQPDPAKAKTGWIVLGVGGGLTVAGIVLDIVGSTQGAVAGAGGVGDSGTTSNARTNFYWGGTALIIAGIVTGVVGGSMIMNSTKATRPPEDEAQNTDGLTKTAQAAYQSAPGFTVPLLGTTF